jgi:hypothetical protein
MQQTLQVQGWKGIREGWKSEAHPDEQQEVTRHVLSDEMRECTDSDVSSNLGNGKMISAGGSAGGSAGRCARLGSTSSATARDGRTNSESIWRVVGRATGWKAQKYWHVQISELFFVEICNQAVMDFLAATEVGKFLRR